MYKYILDPTTNTLENIYSIRGNKIINNYIKYIKGGRKISDSEKNKINKLLDDSKIYAPKSYFEGLSFDEAQKRLKRIEVGSKSDHKDPDSYSKFETDFRNGKRIKTKPSKYTNQWNEYFPDAKSLEDKSELTGVPLDIIQKVYNKGLAAWRTGHRPGATGQQWGYARVHSFLVKGKTYWYTDRKLALEAIEKSSKAKEWFDSIDGLCDLKKNREENTWCVTRKICSKIKCKE